MSVPSQNKASQFAAAAEALVGTPFRLHGRDPRFGIDCVGLIAASFNTVGLPVEAPRNYGLRNLNIEALLPFAKAAGLQQFIGSEAAIRRGDILLVCPGPAQHHLVVMLDQWRVVHAHAGLRRVVSCRRPLDWPIQIQWRMSAASES
ncbi:hypothetical protein HME9302_02230 [Alteripontixanthobacter maritimus]|uniref:NlpC/P60 domain-containing protein n=1 Tax=Alteripontixanthobacter maritimus TaxID=2161824 RepID=A0A369Q7Z9_9SPHN|nr:NlpC/P60 family protein [Alteripontixanthobacter maritimus]RDC61013.1 hypothetical protein HME9302_02230 [Alteripontixanthobacter maritimus]